jgi:hypothetical protein
VSEDENRAMKHSSTRDLYGYWNQRRGARAAPERVDIDPTAIPRLLADTFLLGSDVSGELVFRLAGTRVCALFCRELKGEEFLGLFARSSRDQADDLVGTVCDEPVATVAGVTAQLGDASTAELELLLLPLRHDGRTNSRILGVLAPVTAPYWLGAVPVVSLTLGMLRHIGPVVPRGPHPPPPPHGRPRHGFVVYDGGRS